VSANGSRAWRLRVELPAGYDEDSQELFEWLRRWLIPACLEAPIRVTLSLVPPSDRPEDDTPGTTE